MKDNWPVWEVFVQGTQTKSYEHVGNVHAPDPKIAMQNARDVYARREKVRGIWVVMTKNIHATTPKEEGPFFDPMEDTPYRHPQFYSQKGS